MGEIDFLKFTALLDEFETANKLVKLGFGELQNINLTNDFYFLPFQLLSQGFERFMKAYICVGYYEKHTTLPDLQYLKNLGHDLEKLFKEIKDNYYIVNTSDQFKKDWEFLNNEEDLKELLYILSEFGKIARYHNFDFITDNPRIGINAKESWEKFEDKILKNSVELINKLTNLDIQHEVYHEIVNYIIIIFEKFIASLSRQILFNTLGELGKRLTISSFYDYGKLYEGEFGKTDYRQDTLKYKNTPRSIHKRTEIDELNRKNDSNFKFKKIHKNEYEGDWPFYADEIIIECRYKHWCIVSIEGYDYALNGSAQGKYKLETPHEAGMAILGKSIADFITMASEL